MSKGASRLGFRAALILPILAGLWSLSVPESATAQGAVRKVPAGSASKVDLPGPLDDAIFRPTVLVRKGNSRGSGTIIASVKGRALVLTAAHVIDGPGKAAIELHRFNLGIEDRNFGGSWPRVVPARIVASDPDADVAILLVEGLTKLPYVARLGESLADPPPVGSRVTSVGIDQASDLNSWDSVITGTGMFSRNRIEETRGPLAPAPRLASGELSREARLYLTTQHPPIHGRSGGGLYSREGRLLGVCVARIEVRNGEGQEATIGLFASGRSIRGLLEEIEHASRTSTSSSP